MKPPKKKKIAIIGIISQPRIFDYLACVFKKGDLSEAPSQNLIQPGFEFISAGI
jgi:hypothetical protein